jgi:hypothetical protein
VRYNPEIARQCLRFWITAQRATESEVLANMRAQGVAAVLQNVEHWLAQWLLGSSVSLRLGQVEASDFYEELIRLALCLEVEFWDLREFRQYASYARMSSQMDSTSVLLELADARRLLIDKGGSLQARELFAVEQQLATLYDALSCSLSPERAEVTVAEPGTLLDAAERLFSLVDGRPGKEVEEQIRRADALLASARKYTACNLERSRRMSDNALRFLEESRDDRLIVVTGGFHARNLTRVLERRRDVSWYIAHPKMDLNRQQADPNPYLLRMRHGEGGL